MDARIVRRAALRCGLAASALLGMVAVAGAQTYAQPAQPVPYYSQGTYPAATYAPRYPYAYAAAPAYGTSYGSYNPGAYYGGRSVASFGVGAGIDQYRSLDDLATGRGLSLAKPWMRPLR